MTDVPKPPAGLSRSSARLWRDVLADFELSPAELAVLAEALTSLDRAHQAAEVIAAEGVCVTDRYGSPKSHPAVDVEARSRAIFARLVAQLGVKLLPDAPPSRRGRKTGPKPMAARSRP